MANMHNPPHPGEVLREWLEGITVTEAASRLGAGRLRFDSGPGHQESDYKKAFGPA